MKIKSYLQSNQIKYLITRLCAFNVLSALILFIIGLLVPSQSLYYSYESIWILYFFLTAIPLVSLLVLNEPPIRYESIKLNKQNTRIYRLLVYTTILLIVIGIIGEIFLQLNYGGIWPQEDPKFRAGKYFLRIPYLELKPFGWKEVPFEIFIFALRTAPALFFGIISGLNTLSFKAWSSKLYNDNLNY